jgi:hypothetical protein
MPWLVVFPAGNPTVIRVSFLYMYVMPDLAHCTSHSDGQNSYFLSDSSCSQISAQRLKTLNHFVVLLSSSSQMPGLHHKL